MVQTFLNGGIGLNGNGKVLDRNFTVSGLTTLTSGSTLTINSGKTLTAAGGLTADVGVDGDIVIDGVGGTLLIPTNANCYGHRSDKLCT